MANFCGSLVSHLATDGGYGNGVSGIFAKVFI